MLSKVSIYQMENFWTSAEIDRTISQYFRHRVLELSHTAEFTSRNRTCGPTYHPDRNLVVRILIRSWHIFTTYEYMLPLKNLKTLFYCSYEFLIINDYWKDILLYLLQYSRFLEICRRITIYKYYDIYSLHLLD